MDFLISDGLFKFYILHFALNALNALNALYVCACLTWGGWAINLSTLNYVVCYETEYRKK